MLLWKLPGDCPCSSSFLNEEGRRNRSGLGVG